MFSSRNTIHSSWLQSCRRMICQLRRHRLSILHQEILQVVEQFFIFASQECNGHTLLSCSTSSSCSVDKTAYILRSIEVHDQCNTLDIQTSLTQICCDKDIILSYKKFMKKSFNFLTVFESFDSGFSLLLSFTTMIDNRIPL